jgi:HTH-type transcriptional regulator / antitoxin HigA
MSMGQKIKKIDLKVLDNIRIMPVTNEAEFETADQIINLLIDADLIEDPVERKRASDILEAVSILAHAYEKKHYPIPKPTPIEAIKESMEQLNLSQKDIAHYLGGENRVSEVLSGKRQLTIKMIKALHQNLNISANVLLGL